VANQNQQLLKQRWQWIQFSNEYNRLGPTAYYSPPQLKIQPLEIVIHVYASKYLALHELQLGKESHVVQEVQQRQQIPQERLARAE
jgi:hypothetical protein